MKNHDDYGSFEYYSTSVPIFNPKTRKSTSGRTTRKNDTPRSAFNARHYDH